MEEAGHHRRSEGMREEPFRRRFRDLGGSCRAPRTRSEPVGAEPPATRPGRRPGGRSDAVAIPPTTGPVYPHPLPLSGGDQTLSVELREGRGCRGAARHGRGPARREEQRAE